MNVKDIYLKIDNLITEQHRSLKSFCANTNRSYSSLARTMSETIYNGKGAHLVTTEEILNDLGYELTIQKKSKEVWKMNWEKILLQIILSVATSIITLYILARYFS